MSRCQTPGREMQQEWKNCSRSGFVAARLRCQTRLTSLAGAATIEAAEPARAAGARGSVRGGDVQAQAVDVADLPAQVPDVRLRVDAADAGGALQRLARRELAAVPVQVLAQPRPQRPELALLERLGQVRQVGGHPLPQLRRDQVAERVR